MTPLAFQENVYLSKKNDPLQSIPLTQMIRMPKI